MVVWRSRLIDDQHDCQASVVSSVLRGKPARMCVALSATADILFPLALLQIKETDFFQSEYRQASERQEVAHKSTCSLVFCPELDFADLDFSLCRIWAVLLTCMNLLGSQN